MADGSFVHLHVHSEFSMLDGAARITDAVQAAVADGQPALGLTDHGVLFGAVDFYKKAGEAGIRPILGVEGYLTPGSRYERPAPAENIRYHITLLAENQTGYQNLVKLVSRAYLEGYYYKPRMDDELLSEYSEGLIATSGCLGGHVPQLLAPDASLEEGNIAGSRDKEAAIEAAAMYQDIFGKENFFIELHDHGIEAQQRILPDLVDISRQIGAPLLATNDAHYTRKDEAEAHDVLLCIQTGKELKDPGRLKFEGEEFYLKTAREMRDLFPQDTYPGACDNTLWIAERARVRFDFDRLLLPHFPVPAGHTSLSYLRELVIQGARERYGGDLGGPVGERIEHELRIIEQMGFPDYFLIVWDLIRYAKDRRIRTGPGRGSAAGSIVSYSLGITDLDPLEYGLIFERFLNPGRREMPDIDMDFDERYRAEVIRYAAEKYGSDHVAQIVTFSTIKGKQALRDAARVLGLPYAVGDRLAKLMPPAVLGREASLEICFQPPSEDAEQLTKDWHANAAGLREASREDEVQPVVNTARRLEGLRRQDSIHAAAVVISPMPVIDLVPVHRKGEEAEVVTQFDMHAIEELGLLKMDILGLRTLSTIDRALDLIEAGTGKRLDIDQVDLEDPATYEVLSRGDTIGMFQLEGTAMRSLIRSLKPDRFEDMIALVALYRPGPMSNDWHNAYADRKNRRKPVDYPHPATEGVLRETYGLMIYQEQVMQIAREIAGYTMADADALRKAMGKKVPAIMRKERAKFVSGVEANGNPAHFGEELFASIEGFAGYGFNKSHSAAYGLLAYQTAYLKVHHPAAYMAALLTSVRRDKDKTALYLNECRTMGIEVLPPSVNASEGDFTVRKGKILFGLSAVRNLGSGMVARIVRGRSEGGSYTSFQDFADRVETQVLNKRIIGSLVKAGAFDELGHSRMGLSLASDEILHNTVVRRRQEDRGQFSLFGDATGGPELDPVTIPDQEWDQKTLLSFEKEMLGLYVSDHPLLGISSIVRHLTTAAIRELREMDDRSRVKVCGIVSGTSRRFTKGGKEMAFFTLEDMEASVEVMAFPKTMEHASSLIQDDAIRLVEGQLSNSGDDLKIRSHTITEPDLTGERELRLRVPTQALSDGRTVHQLKDILTNHPGSCPVYLRMIYNGTSKLLLLDDNLRVDLTLSLYADIRNLLGAAAVA